jgi:DNA modification methylase
MISVVLLGDASKWFGTAHAVFTHPYAPLPACVHGLPVIINLYTAVKEDRKSIAEGWCNTELYEIGKWGHGHNNTVYVGNIPPRTIVIEDLIEDPYKPNIGWFPIQLPMRILTAYSDIIKPPMTVWDGFAGRGTVGVACSRLGLSYIGVDNDPERVAMSRNFINPS